MKFRLPLGPTVFFLTSAIGLSVGCGASSSDDSDQSESAARGEQTGEMDEAPEDGMATDSASEDGAPPAQMPDQTGASGEEGGGSDADAVGDPGPNSSEGEPSGSGTLGPGAPGAEDAAGDDDGGMEDDGTGSGTSSQDAGAPDTSGADCTSRCPVPRICMACGDGCAEAFVPCTPDGECGDVEWLCDEGDEPLPEPDPKPPGGELTCPANCPVPALCQLCDDGSCASARPSCNDDGSCGAIDWQCADEPVDVDPSDGIACRQVSDCPQILAVCRDCPNGGLACPTMQCIEGQCVTTGNECASGTDGDYDPCAGKEDGEMCSLCPPNAVDCLETDEIKTCQRGQCESGVSISR